MKKILAVLTTVFALTASACWFQTTNYNNYVVGINNYERHVEQNIEYSGTKIQSITYYVTNNIVVDFPVSVFVKLSTPNPVYIPIPFSFENRAAPNVDYPEMLYAKLQYRVLSRNGVLVDENWQDVEEIEIESGTIPDDSPAAPYFGRNNIAPSGLVEGDALMIRVAISLGTWNNGDESSKCIYNNNYIQDYFEYKVSNRIEDIAGDSDLGGGWLPHYVVVLIYSGKTRPVN